MFIVYFIKKSFSNESISITCNIHNNGSRDGAEVVQVYIGKKGSRVARAPKELKGFQKVYLKAGEQKSIKISIDPASLAYYDEDAGDWQLEKGVYTVYVGTASNKVDRQFEIEVN